MWAAWGAGVGVPLGIALIAWGHQLQWRHRDDPQQNHQRADNGISPLPDRRRNWFIATFAHPWAWVIVALIVACAFSLWIQYIIIYGGLVQSINATLEQNDLPQQTLSIAAFNEGLVKCFSYAALTLVAYVVIFLLLDRFRPSSPSMKFTALLWGCAGATGIAIFVNSWMSDLLAAGAGPDMADSASAVFVAPFVEEACKATILFWLIMAMRRRMCSVLQMIGLSGLSAAGFAFVENAIYYVRIYCTATLIPGISADDYLGQLVWLRGVLTSFGHPLFTMMTAFGLIVGLRQRSKVVRVVAPLAGYLVAAVLHMCFNGLATIMDDYSVLLIIGLILVFGVVMWLIGQLLSQRQVIAWRLDDYVRMGWLRDRDPAVYASPMSRLKLTTAGWLRGWRIGKATVRLMSAITELAYLRQFVTTGINDDGVTSREHELVVDAAAMRGIGLDEPVGLRLVPRYRGPAAWHTFKAWRARRAASRQAPAPWATPAPWPTPAQAPWRAPAPAPWGSPVRV